MSVDIATLGIKVDATQADSAGNSLDRLTNKGAKAEGATKDLTRSFGGLKTALAGLGISLSVAEIGKLADTYKNIQGKLGLVTKGTDELAYVTGKLYDISQRTRVGFEGVADLYGSLARSTKSLGVSQAQLLQVTETINQALVVSGASGASAQAALVQLGQGFAGGALRGDELNSVMEQTPRLAQAIADGMNITVGQLRALGAEGKITGEAVFNALKSQKDVLEQEFATMPVTISQSFTVLSNAVMKYIGEADSANGASAGVAKSITLIANNIDTLVTAIEVVAVMFGIKLVSSYVAASVAALAQQASLIGITSAAGIAGFAVGTLIKAMLTLAALTGVALLIVGLTNAFIENANMAKDLETQHRELGATLILTGDNSNSAAKQVTGLGGDASASAVLIASFTGDVAQATRGLNDMALAARSARLEMLATKVMKAREIEDGYRAATSSGIENDQGRNSQAVRDSFRQKDFRNLGRISIRPLTNSINNLISGGKASQEADGKLKTATSDRVALEGELKAEANNPNYWIKNHSLPPGGAASRAAPSSKHKGNSGKSEAEREADRLEAQNKRDIEQSTNYKNALDIETAAIGKNVVQTRMDAIAKAAAEAPTKDLTAAILASGEAWKKANNTQAIKEFNIEFKKQNDEIEFQNSLLGMNAVKRAEAIARHTVELRQQALEAAGIHVSAPDIADETQRNIGLATQQGQKELDAQNVKDYSNAVHDMNDALRESVSHFGELFGTAGEGFSNLINVIADYSDRRRYLEDQITEATARGTAGDVDRARATRELGGLQIEQYGAMLSAAKGFFKEGSTGYKVLEGIEKAYYLFKFAMQIKSMFFDKAQTVSSVTNSGARAAADGVAAIAKAIASLPFPLNIIAGAATAAALISFGVKVFGGGKGGSAPSASESATKSVDGYNGPRDAYGNPTSAYSVLKPGSTTVANDNSTMPTMAGKASNVGSISIGDVNLTIQGDANKDTIDRVQAMLEQNRQQTLAQARQLAAQDNANRSSRQFIGG